MVNAGREFAPAFRRTVAMKFMGTKELIINRMEDLAVKAVKSGYAASRFLTPAEAAAVQTHFIHRHDIGLILDGGYEGAERVRAVFLNTAWGEYERSELFAALQIVYRPQDLAAARVEAPTHRDILGALMASGVGRDTVGDIIAQTQPAVFVCLPELCGYISENLTQVGRLGIKIMRIPIGEIPSAAENLHSKTDTVASLRLDAVLCAAYDISRSNAVALINDGRVNLNHIPCMNPVKEVSEGDLLSVRGYGRVRLIEIGGLSRKGRIFIKLGVY